LVSGAVPPALLPSSPLAVPSLTNRPPGDSMKASGGRPVWPRRTAHAPDVRAAYTRAAGCAAKGETFFATLSWPAPASPPCRRLRNRLRTGRAGRDGRGPSPARRPAGRRLDAIRMVPPRRPHTVVLWPGKRPPLPRKRKRRRRQNCQKVSSSAELDQLGWQVSMGDKCLRHNATSLVVPTQRSELHKCMCETSKASLWKGGVYLALDM
jgi:hypothetical protein